MKLLRISASLVFVALPFACLSCQVAPLTSQATQRFATRSATALARDNFPQTAETSPTFDLLESREDLEESVATQPHLLATAPSIRPLAAANAGLSYSITIKRSFAEYYANRATLSTVFHAFSHANEADGDIHIAGYADDMVLPGVSEITNGYEHQALNPELTSLNNGTTHVTGVWRLWCEHPDPQHPHVVQDAAVPAPHSGIYHHVFEVHPLTRLGQHDLTSTFHPIDENHYTFSHDADDCFHHYAGLNCVVASDAQTITIKTSKAAYNYPDFYIKLASTPQAMDDGSLQAQANAYNATGTKLATCRVIFVKGTPPAAVAATLSTSQRVHVMGLVRMDLDIILARANSGVNTRQNLPFEIVILGIF
jgi:hypothetical protein